jgi:hypothetical protein
MAVYAEEASARAAPEEGAARFKKRKVSDTGASSDAAPLIRYLYYKSHSTSSTVDGVKPGCTLFVVNIPFSYTEDHLRTVFACFGGVESVTFLQSGAQMQLCIDTSAIGAVTPSTFYRSAHVAFEDEADARTALTTDLSRMPQQCPEEKQDQQNVGMKSKRRRREHRHRGMQCANRRACVSMHRMRRCERHC